MLTHYSMATFITPNSETAHVLPGVPTQIRIRHGWTFSNNIFPVVINFIIVLLIFLASPIKHFLFSHWSPPLSSRTKGTWFIGLGNGSWQGHIKTYWSHHHYSLDYIIIISAITNIIIILLYLLECCHFAFIAVIDWPIKDYAVVLLLQCTRGIYCARHTWTRWNVKAMANIQLSNYDLFGGLYLRNLILTWWRSLRVLH